MSAWTLSLGPLSQRGQPIDTPRSWWVGVRREDWSDLVLQQYRTRLKGSRGEALVTQLQVEQRRTHRDQTEGI